MSGNKSYDKGYRHEHKVQSWLAQYGKCVRAHRSGAYTGEPDLKFWWSLRAWTVCCKTGKDWVAKRYRDRLEKADILIDGKSRDIPIVILTLPKLLELMGAGE